MPPSVEIGMAPAGGDVDHGFAGRPCIHQLKRVRQHVDAITPRDLTHGVNLR